MKLTQKEMRTILDSVGGLEEGDTINTHHCKQGSNNDRLYISHKGDAILFYCHHCGGKGAIRVKYAAVKRKLSTGHHLPPRHSTTMPYDCVDASERWPIPAEKWLISCGIKKHEALSRGIKYSAKLNRVVIPIVFNGEYKGYVARQLDGEGPKYLARCKDSTDFIYSLPSPTKEVVLVEDIASCIRVAEHTSCVALQGTDISEELLSYLITNWSSFIIWMDDDNPQVKLKQAKLLNRLGMFGSVKLIKTEHDPKTYSSKEIEEYLNDSH